MTTLHKTYNKGEVQQMVVNTDLTDVTFKSGSDFHVDYTGKDGLDVTKQGHTLQIVERNSSKRKMLNLNPFNTVKSQLEITIPKNQLKNLNVRTQVANVDVEGITLDHVVIENDMNGQVAMRNSHFKHTQVKGYETFIKIKNSQLFDSDISVNKGLIQADQTTVRKSIFKVGKGDITLSMMTPHCDLKGIVDKGDIHMSFQNTPKDVHFKLNPTKGEAQLINPELHQGINGRGTHQIELYTNNGDIIIE
ncbi:DUF4097 family beta strand repeat-containing protein [Staphylococcus sp. 17KM0847]|uniref:DUF4097 family beta strand repeat-containing protein n=1 Tax=Staphylococcus sp. 17KM0847 TaxID=2583989 RepID=UPI0015DDFA1F|nr:DUF4097 family beta strand repeat-containing protein [Staphylococcus sp. 17KM0847]